MNAELLESIWSGYKDHLELDKQADEDPEDDPFRSKYSARQKLLQALELLQDVSLASTDGCVPVRAYALLLLAKNQVHTEERAAGEQSCRDGLQLLQIDPDQEATLSEHYALCPDTVYVYLALLNYLAFIFESRSDHEKALKYLTDAELVYSAYKVTMDEQTVPVPPWWTWQRLCRQPEAENEDYSYAEALKQFELVHTHTIYYLAQVYKNIEERDKAANYCEKTLVRQLEADDFDALEWSLNAATLSQYYVDKATVANRAALARAHHCLAAAEAVYHTAHPGQTTDAPAEPAGDDEDDASDRRRNTLADIHRCWAKFGLSLLDLSHQRRMAGDDEDEGECPPSLKPTDEQLRLDDVKLTDASDNEAECPAPSLDFDLSEATPLFPRLQLHNYETQITNGLVDSFESARLVFLKVQHWLQEAQKYYTIDTHCSDYIECAQDQSRLFRLLANFELDIGRKCKMHKRRIDMLQQIIDQVSSTFYQRLCQQMLFECAETSNEMLNLKLDALQENGQEPNAHQAAKINLLATQGIQYFQKFLDTFKTPSGEDTEKYGPEAVRAAVLAHFYMARLWSKVLAAETNTKLSYLAASLKHYRWIVDYCEQTDPDAKQLVAEEYSACREMAQLLPVKMSRIQQHLM